MHLTSFVHTCAGRTNMYIPFQLASIELLEPRRARVGSGPAVSWCKGLSPF
jgi:hypothetical protein